MRSPGGEESSKDNEMEIEEREESVLACKSHIICFGQRAIGFCSASVTLLLLLPVLPNTNNTMSVFTWAKHMHCAVMWHRDDDVMALYC